MNYNDISITKKQANSFALSFYRRVEDYIAAHSNEYEKWLKQKAVKEFETPKITTPMGGMEIK